MIMYTLGIYERSVVNKEKLTWRKEMKIDLLQYILVGNKY